MPWRGYSRGQPSRSDGKLTVKSLAIEAGVKRWLLTHKHTDLQTEFRDRIRTHGSIPDAMRTLVAENHDLKKRLDRTRTDLRRALSRTQRYARMVQVDRARENPTRGQAQPARVEAHPLPIERATCGRMTVPARFRKPDHWDPSPQRWRYGEQRERRPSLSWVRRAV